MKKFKIKNRQKRKYTRHHVAPQSAFSLKTIVVSLLPLVVVAVAFITMYLINLNLREQTSSIQPSLPAVPTIVLPEVTPPHVAWGELVRPFQSLPNIFVEPLAFVTGFIPLILTALQTALIAIGNLFTAFFVIPDPRSAFVVIASFVTTLFTFISSITLAMFSGLGDGLSFAAQSLSMFITSIVLYVQSIATTFVEFIVKAVYVIFSSILFVLQGVAWFLGIIVQGIVSAILFVGAKIGAGIDAIVRVILIPFQILGAFWLKIKPYVDILLVHMGMAFADLGQGVESFNELAEAME